jgi:hypothetical protein
MPKNKYYNKKVTVDGITFDSKKEANRYCELRLLERAGQIKNLERQKVFELIPTQREILPEKDKNGNHKVGKVIERPIKYKADFTYIENGKLVVEDTKGYRTTEYVMKRKMMLFLHGIRIREI